MNCEKIKEKACGNPKCSISTGIVSGLTFGSGYLNDNGYWEHPCFECARAYEAENPGEHVWPFEDMKKV